MALSCMIEDHRCPISLRAISSCGEAVTGPVAEPPEAEEEAEEALEAVAVGFFVD